MTPTIVDASGSYFLLLCAIVVLIYGTFKAFENREDYPRLLGFGLVADLGCMIMAFAAAQGIATVGAFIFIIFQVVSRALAFFAYNNLCRIGFSANDSYDFANDFVNPKHYNLIRGALKNPLNASLFALGMFACIGGSPFLVPEGRFFASQGIMAANFTGAVPALLIVACCNLIFVWLHLNIVRKVYFEYTNNHHKWSINTLELSAINWSSIALGFAVVILGLLRTPFTDFIAELCTVELEHAPVHMSFVVLFVGSFVLAMTGLKFPNCMDKISVAFMALALVCAISLGELTPMARLFAVLICGVGLLVCIYSYGYMSNGHRLLSYYFFLLLTFAALLGIVTTANLGVFYGYWELMTFASYFLVIHERVGAAARTVLDAGSKYYLMCAGGALIMLPGFALFAANGADFTSMTSTSLGMNPLTLKLALMLTLVGFAAKAGIVPLQAWLPDAHPAAPSSVSGPLSGIITKLGIFGIITLLLGQAGDATLQMSGFGSLFQKDTSPLPLSWFGYNLSFLGALTLIYGEVMALRQDDIKRMLAYSTLGQLGEIVLVLGLGTYLATVAALTHVINHAIMKDLLFLGAGALILRTGSRKIEDLRGLGASMPLTVGFMAVGLLSIMGLPPFAGFAGKYLMIQAIMSTGHWLMAVLIIAGSLVGAVYYTRILRTLIFEKRSLPLQVGNVREEGPMNVALGVLAFLCVILGLFPELTQCIIAGAAGQYFTSSPSDVATLLSMQVDWPIYVVVPMLGALIPCFLRHNRILAGRITVGVLLLTSLLVLIFAHDLDTLSFGFALIVPLIGALNMTYALGYMEHSHTQWRFYAFFCAMCAGLLGLASAKYLFSFFLFWEIMSSWTLYFTIAHEGTKESLNEAFKYFIFNLAGAGFIFIGVCILGATATLNIFDITGIWLSYGEIPEGMAYAAYALLALGFVMKAAQLPLRIDWQMHPALAPTPVSGFISSVLLKSALFGLMKLFIIIGGGMTLLHTITPEDARHVQTLVMWVGGITIVMASMQALLSSNLKLIFIYSTVSQIGYMVLAVAVGTSLGFAGGLLHVINHVFFKDLLFLMCGVIMFQSHKDNLQDLGGIGHKMPFTLAMFAIAGLSVVGIPPTSGFTSKWIIYHALMQENQPFLALLSLVGSVITLAYIAKFLHTAFMGQQSNNSCNEVQDAPLLMRVPMLILAVACVILGIFPGIMLYPINAVLAEYGLQTLQVDLTGLTAGPAAWNATNMFIMMGLALVITWKALNYFVSKNYRITPIHSCGLTPGDATSRMKPNSVYGGLVTFWRESIWNLRKK